MATSKTRKAGPDRKGTGSAEKAAGSTGKIAAGSTGTAAAGSTGQAAGGSAKKATGSSRKTASSGRKTTGSSAKAAGGSAKKATGSSQKTATAGSATKTTSGSRRKTAGSTAKTASGSGRKTAGSTAKTAVGHGRKVTGSRGKTSVDSGRKTGSSGSKASGSRPETGIYVYGILPADVELTAEVPGVGDPPGQIRVVRSDGLAALVSEVELSRELGSPGDLTAHKDILDASAAELPVLPLRFGAVLNSEDAVAEELLDANHDEFTDALDELDGRAQFVVKARYVEDAILGEVLSENKRAARLAEKIQGKNSDATRDTRIQLGEMINGAIAAKREKDTQALGDAMQGHCVASVVRDPTHELDAVHAAFLIESDQESDMQAVIEDLARDWAGRIEVRLLGPMAAYDFVGIREPVG